MFETKWTHDLTSTIYEEAKAIRFKVFVKEQQVPKELELDELEAVSEHLVLYEEGEPVATARIYEKEKDVYKIQRVAVSKDKRGLGYGAKVMRAAEERIQELGGRKILLGAQIQALPFYEKLGYKVASEEYLDAGIPHYDVEKALP